MSEYVRIPVPSLRDRGMHTKGESRARNNERFLGRTHPRDSQPHSKYPESAKASRKKGRNRFKTGKKSQGH